MYGAPALPSQVSPTLVKDIFDYLREHNDTRHADYVVLKVLWDCTGRRAETLCISPSQQDAYLKEWDKLSEEIAPEFTYGSLVSPLVTPYGATRAEINMIQVLFRITLTLKIYDWAKAILCYLPYNRDRFTCRRIDPMIKAVQTVLYSCMWNIRAFLTYCDDQKITAEKIDQNRIDLILFSHPRGKDYARTFPRGKWTLPAVTNESWKFKPPANVPMFNIPTRPSTSLWRHTHSLQDGHALAPTALQGDTRGSPPPAETNDQRLQRGGSPQVPPSDNGLTLRKHTDYGREMNTRGFNDPARLGYDYPRQGALAPIVQDEQERYHDGLTIYSSDGMYDYPTEDTEEGLSSSTELFQRFGLTLDGYREENQLDADGAKRPSYWHADPATIEHGRLTDHTRYTRVWAVKDSTGRWRPPPGYFPRLGGTTLQKFPHIPTRQAVPLRGTSGAARGDRTRGEESKDNDDDGEDLYRSNSPGGGRQTAGNGGSSNGGPDNGRSMNGNGGRGNGGNGLPPAGGSSTPPPPPFSNGSSPPPMPPDGNGSSTASNGGTNGNNNNDLTTVLRTLLTSITGNNLSRDQRSTITTELPKFDPERKTAQQHIKAFDHWRALAMPSDNQLVPAFISSLSRIQSEAHSMENDFHKEVDKYVSLSHLERFRIFAEIFLKRYTANHGVLTSRRNQLDGLIKSPEETIEKFTARWDHACSLAYPHGDISLADKKRLYIKALENTPQRELNLNEENRVSAAGYTAAGDTDNWINFTGRVHSYYKSRDPEKARKDAYAAATRQAFLDHSVNGDALYPDSRKRRHHSREKSSRRHRSRSSSRSRSRSRSPHHRGKKHAEAFDNPSMSSEARRKYIDGNNQLPSFMKGPHKRARSKSPETANKRPPTAPSTHQDRTHRGNTSNFRPGRGYSGTFTQGRSNPPPRTQQRSSNYHQRPAAHAVSGVNQTPLGDGQQGSGGQGGESNSGFRRYGDKRIFPPCTRCGGSIYHDDLHCPRNMEGKSLKKDPNYRWIPPRTDGPGTHAISWDFKKNRLMLDATLAGIKTAALLDTGSDANLMSRQLFERLQPSPELNKTSVKDISIADQSSMKPEGQCDVSTTLHDKATGRTYTHIVTYLVVPKLTYDLILGSDGMSFCIDNLSLVLNKPVFRVDIDPDGMRPPDPPNKPVFRSPLIAVKGSVLPPHSAKTVTVRFNPYLAQQHPVNTPVLCEPHLRLDGRMQALPEMFPPYLAPTAAERGVHTIILHNYTDHVISIAPSSEIGSATVLLTEALHHFEPQSTTLQSTGGTTNQSPSPSVNTAATTGSTTQQSTPSSPRTSPSQAAASLVADAIAQLADSFPEKEFNINPALTPSQREQVLLVLKKHIRAFIRPPTDGPPRAHGVDFRIYTDDAPPIKQVPYRHSPQQEAYIREEVKNLLKKGYVTPSFSPWASPVLVVVKKDGTYRMCIDYRKLNAHTKKDAYPLPRIEDCLELCREAIWMTIFDLRDAYHHIPVHPDSQAATAFCTKDGLYQWTVMPFGATGAPGCFQRYVDSVFRGMTGRNCVVYFDDIVVYSKDFETHLKDVAEVLQRLQDCNLSAKISKCKIAMNEITFVGHVLRNGTIKPDPEKLRAVDEFPRPSDVSHLKSFLGLANYYRKFIAGFAQTATPLYHLTKKNVEYYWNQFCEAAYHRLKKQLLEAPCLYSPDPSKPFILQTDASGEGIAAVLTQKIDGEEHPVGYVSRQYVAAEKNYAVTEQECLAVVYGVQQFQHYLIDHPFTVVTDHHALQWLPSKKSTNKRLARWAIYLSQFPYSVQYRKGSENANADALSRSPVAPLPTDKALNELEHEREVRSSPHTNSLKITVANLTTFTPLQLRAKFAALFGGQAHPQVAAIKSALKERSVETLPHEPYHEFIMVDEGKRRSLIEAQQDDPDCKDFLAYLLKKEVPASLSEPDKKQFVSHAQQYHAELEEDDLHTLYYLPTTKKSDSKNAVPLEARLVVPRKFREDLLSAYHEGPLGGHLGIAKTFRRLSYRYWWKGMWFKVCAHVNGCKQCAEDKIRRRANKHRSGPTTHPTEPMQCIAMDICTISSATSEDFKYVLIMVCMFTRWAICVPLMSKHGAYVAKVIITHLICVHGCPRIILSDNGTEFKNACNDQIFAALGVRRMFSSAYHPEANGQAERLVGTIKAIIYAQPAFVQQHNLWVNHLYTATFAYNTSPSSTTGISPFYMLYGRHPRMPFDLVDTEQLEASSEPPTDAWALEQYNRLSSVYGQVRQTQDAAQHQRMLKELNITRFSTYKVGDIVYKQNPAQILEKNRRSDRPDSSADDRTRSVHQYVGPYRVTQRIGNVMYMIQPLDKKGRESGPIHFVHLKPFRADSKSELIPPEEATSLFPQENTSYLRPEPTTTPPSQDSARDSEQVRAERKARREALRSLRATKAKLKGQQDPKSLSTPAVRPHKVNPDRQRLIEASDSVAKRVRREHQQKSIPIYDEKLLSLQGGDPEITRLSLPSRK